MGKVGGLTAYFRPAVALVAAAAALLVLAAACGGTEPEARPTPQSPAEATAEPTAVPTPTRVIDRPSVNATVVAEEKLTAGNCNIAPETDCEGADFEGADLSPLTPDRGTAGLYEGAELAGANLKNADMSGVNLWMADLEGADLTGADLTDAYLNNVNFKNAILREVNLTNANLSWALLRDADLDGAIFCNTLMPDGGTRNDDC